MPCKECFPIEDRVESMNKPLSIYMLNGYFYDVIFQKRFKNRSILSIIFSISK
jgi:hypothetical protein